MLTLSGKIAEKEQELANLPQVIQLNEEIRELKKSLLEKQSSDFTLREQGKSLMLDNDLKEFTTLDGTTVALHFTPWALVVEEWAEIPESFYKVKTTRDLDKTAIKKAITDGTINDPKIYIQKDCKFVVKSK